MGSKIGIMKVSAKRLGIDFEEYMAHVNNGEKHCGKCRTWVSLDKYHVDNNRGDGRASVCISCRKKDNPRHPWKGGKLLDGHRKKISDGLKKFYKNNVSHVLGKPSPQKGFKRTKEQLENIRLGKIGKQKYGSESHSYIDGRTKETRLLRKNKMYRDWRKTVYERDEYTCQNCGDSKGGNLNAHHIKSWKDYPELRYESSNGVTLCKPCHRECHRKHRSK